MSHQMHNHDPADADDRLLRRLREIANRCDPVPPSVRAAARSAFTWRTVDAELALLAYDSALEHSVGAGVRGPVTARVLTFETPDISIELEVGGEAENLRVLGQVAPGQLTEIELHQAGAVRSVSTDALGRFSVSGLRRGPLQLRCRPDGATSIVATDWVAI